MLEYTERKGTGCSKWDGLEETFGADGLLPLWVADMDFRVDKHIRDALAAYMETGVYGYNTVPDSYYEAFIDWEKDRHGLAVRREWIRYSPGVVSGFNFALQVLTQPGDAVIVTTPVYYPFLHAVENNGRRLICSELVNRDGRYYIDFDDFERKVTDNDVKAFILCSPHNPVSRVWSSDELKQILDICRRHDVAVISDEIHHDVVIRNEVIRAAWDKFIAGLRISMGNPMGYIAAEAGYRHGGEWLSEVKDVIYGNYLYIKEEFAKHLPGVVMTPLEATYLAWADFSAYLRPEEIQPFMQDKCRLAFDYGSWFGGDRSGSFIRINLATRRENIEEVVHRITDNLK